MGKLYSFHGFDCGSDIVADANGASSVAFVVSTAGGLNILMSSNFQYNIEYLHAKAAAADSAHIRICAADSDGANQVYYTPKYHVVGTDMGLLDLTYPSGIKVVPSSTTLHLSVEITGNDSDAVIDIEYGGHAQKVIYSS
jgi:hypothetical protein